MTTPTAQSGPSDRAIAQAFRELHTMDCLHGDALMLYELAVKIESAQPPAGARDAVTDYIAANDALAAWHNTPRNHARGLDADEEDELIRLQNAVDAGYEALKALTGKADGCADLLTCPRLVCGCQAPQPAATGAGEWRWAPKEPTPDMLVDLSKGADYGWKSAYERMWSGLPQSKPNTAATGMGGAIAELMHIRAYCETVGETHSYEGIISLSAIGAAIEALAVQPAPVDAEDTLRKICDLFGIGVDARTPSIILTNITNIKRFSEYLHAVEREFLMVPGEPDDDYPGEEPGPECLVNRWGARDEADYVEQFRDALQTIQAQTAPVVGGPAAFRFRDREIREEWSKWLGIDELNHYGKDGNLVDGPHQDWDVEYAYKHPPLMASRPVESVADAPKLWMWNQGGEDYRLTAPDEFNAWKWTPLYERAARPGGEGGKDYESLYLDLIYQVGNKYPGESRHDTAKRYLQLAEQITDGAASQGAHPAQAGGESSHD